MTGRRLIILFFSFSLSFQFAFAQDVLNIKFGAITQADFQVTAPAFDSGANAVILADIGKTSFEGNIHGFFSLVFTRFIRVKILNKNGFDIADNRIYLYNDRKGIKEKVTELKGSTFNIENGQIHETKLDDKSVFSTKYSRDLDIIKFSMPALKVGSVYDLTYTTKGNYFSDLPSWVFQDEYPCLWSEYEAEIPSMFHYLVKTTGDSHFDIQTIKPVQKSYKISYSTRTETSNEMLNVSCTAFQSRWVKKNVPVLIEQPYVSTVKNYVSKITFVENYFQQDKEYEKQYSIISWDSLSHYLLVSEDFGFELSQENPWMDDGLKPVAEGSVNAEEEARRIYDFVRDNFHCTDYSEKYIETTLKDVYKKRTGNASELNLLLIALLRHKNISADPVILSTRNNGVVTRAYPLIQEYNYCICLAHIGNKNYLLDASRPFISFNKLPSYCYNWDARVINQNKSDSILLSPDSVTEKKTTTVRFINEESGDFSGSLTTVFGDNQASDTREEIKKTSTKDYFKSIQIKYSNMAVSNESFDSLGRPDYPLVLHYDLNFKDMKGSEILYFNPVMSTSFSTNPFTASQRLYPVEMPAKTDETYLLSMDIPRGFQVDELPKSARVKLNDNQGMFEYLIQQNPDNIQMRVHLKLNQATFPTDDYNTLRDFFAFVVKKESEQIVFKKSH